MRHETEHDEMHREEYWMRDDVAVQEILKNGAKEFFQSQELEETYEHEDLACSCIDERVGGNKLALPGSGILEGDDKAFEILKAAGVNNITSHADCGAAALAFGKLSVAEREKYGSAENYAQEWSKNMANRLRVKYGGHVSVESPGQHIARIVYYDATGNFRADNPKIPRGFTVSRKFTDAASAQSSLELSMKIALGEHGFKNKFSSENPLLIIPIQNGSGSSDFLKEINEVIKRNPEMADKIKVDAGIVIEQPAVEEAA